MKYVQEAFASNWIAPLGPNVDAFEVALENYCSVKHAAALSTGTAALHLALILLGIQPGDEVIASTFTFSATINPIVYLGATPVLIDSEPRTWNIDPELLEKALRERSYQGGKHKVKAIIIVHLYGMPANMEAIMGIANKYEVPVVEDAAEALGSKFNGKPLGSFGKMGVLSFNGNKIITTSGGGALLCDDERIIEKARFLATQARDSAPHYQHSQIGYNYRMSNVLAGIGRGQMEIIDYRVKKKREIFEFYKKNLENLTGISFMEEPNIKYFSNRWLTTILIDPQITGKTPLDIQNVLEKENIESRLLWKPMHLQPIFLKFPSYINGISEKLFEKGLCLPSGSNLTKDDGELIVKLISQ